MSKPTITIVGLGVIGSSLGLALKKAGGNFEIVGHDREPSVSSRAKKLKAVDKTTWNLINATEGADLIMLAVPFSAVEDIFKAISPYLKQGCLVIDTCAVKRPVLQLAEEHLSDNVNFVGGNPIVDVLSDGDTLSGPELARDDLFQNTMFCLCPAAHSRPEAIRLASDLAGTLGALPYYLDAEEHDGLIAGVDHLPAILSAALVEIVSRSPAWREMRKLAGTSFNRISSFPVDSAPALSRTSLSNSDNVSRWIDELIDQLRLMQTSLSEKNTEELEAVFDRAIVNRHRWLRDRSHGFAGEDQPPKTEVPSYWKSMFGMGGGLFRRRGEGAGDEKRR